MNAIMVLFGFLFGITVYAGGDGDLFNKNQAALKSCENFFEKKDGVTIILLLNKTTMRLLDLYTKDNQDEPYLASEIVDCFEKEKILVQSDVIIEDQYYFLINLKNGNRVAIDGMPYLSPDRKYFITNYYGMDGSRVSLYALKKNRIKRIFTTKFTEDECYIKNIKWVATQKVAFDLICDSEQNSTRSFLLIQQKNKSWKLRHRIHRSYIQSSLFEILENNGWVNHPSSLRTNET